MGRWPESELARELHHTNAVADAKSTGDRAHAFLSELFVIKTSDASAERQFATALVDP